MTPAALQTLHQTLSKLADRSRRRATREATRLALAHFGPALRDDLGLTCHRQSINFQNDNHQEHSFD